MCAEDDNYVSVPDTRCPLDEEQIILLDQRINHGQNDGNFGITLFNQTVAEVFRLIGV